jgi:hypothetical protein
MAPTVLWTFARTAYSRMETHHPSLCMLVQHSLLKSLAIASTYSLYALHPNAAHHFD